MVHTRNSRMNLRGGGERTLASSAKWSAKGSATAGAVAPSGREECSAGRLTPQEGAQRLSLRICGVSRFRCRDHLSRPGCGRILSLVFVGADSANGAA